MKYKQHETFIAVDLDRTLAVYHHGEYDSKGKTYIGPPIEKVVNMVKHLIEHGHTVKVFTARNVNDPWIYEAIKEWTKEHIGIPLEATNVKDFRMLCYIDDRAISVSANSGEIIGYDNQLLSIIEDIGI